MALKMVSLRLPAEAVALLDAWAERVGPIPPCDVGRSSVILRMLTRTPPPKDGAGTADIIVAHRALEQYLQPSTEPEPTP